jgi:hypothetical protein
MCHFVCEGMGVFCVWRVCWRCVYLCVLCMCTCDFVCEDMGGFYVARVLEVCVCVCIVNVFCECVEDPI